MRYWREVEAGRHRPHRGSQQVELRAVGRRRRGVVIAPIGDRNHCHTMNATPQDDDFPAALRRLRRTRGLSFRDLASLTQISAGHLSHLERPKRGWSPGVAAALDRALGADGVLITLAGRAPIQDPLSAIPSEVMQRRMFLQLGLVTSASIGIPVPTAANGPAVVHRIVGETGRLHGLDHQHGGTTLWRAAYALLGDSYELIRRGSCRDPLEQDLLRCATGRLHMCTGWLAFDAGRRDGQARLRRRPGWPSTVQVQDLKITPRLAMRHLQAEQVEPSPPGCGSTGLRDSARQEIRTRP
ncbi:helix-turn-helix domain-containing protein [Dactylosporangium salmoneum]|uniref:helix-turn-helix domain-containing protein n=1 Tax=Dactylosporangium salmoneum TaxID=53361 RepID=UPI0031CF8154